MTFLLLHMLVEQNFSNMHNSYIHIHSFRYLEVEHKHFEDTKYILNENHFFKINGNIIQFSYC